MLVRMLPLIALALFVSCAKRDYPSHFRNKLKFQTSVDVEKTLSNWQVACADKNKCPGSVGQITVRKQNSGLEVCTGFLVAPDLVMTNSHCMIDPKTCAANIVIHFPETAAFPAARAECKQATESSPEDTNPMAKDYAFFTLKSSVNREVLKMDKTGVKDNEELQMIMFDPTVKEAIKGTLKIQKVNVVYKSFLTPASDKPNSSVHALVGATAVEGNSGSPIVTADFKSVKLIAQSILDKNLKSLDVFEQLLKSGPNVVYATNLICVEVGPNDKCDDVADKTMQEMKTQNKSWHKSLADLEIVQKLIAERQGHKVFRATFKTSEPPVRLVDKAVETVSFEAIPECFYEPASWLESFKNGNNYLESAKVSWPVTVFKKHIRIDPRGRPDVKIEEEAANKGKSQDLIFSPLQVKTKGNTSIRIGNENKDPLSVCKPN